MDKKVEIFLNKLEILFKQMKEFAKKYNLNWKHGEIEIYEEYAGRYQTKELFVLKMGSLILKLNLLGLI